MFLDKVKLIKISETKYELITPMNNKHRFTIKKGSPVTIESFLQRIAETSSIECVDEIKKGKQ